PIYVAPVFFVALGAYALFSYYASASVALAVSQAHEVTREEEPELHRVVENLSIGSGLPMPKVYVIEDGAPNAFATGRDPKHASVTATRGLLEKLDKPELEGVIAHEMSHVGNYDIRVMTITVVLVGLVALLCRNPGAIASALEKIAGDPDPLEEANKATAHLYFSNPLADHSSFLNNLFSTHPPIQERIRLLRAM